MSNWFGGVAGGRDSAFHVEYDTSLGGLTLSHVSYFSTAVGHVQVIDWGDGSPLEVWDTNAISYDWTTYSLNHTYATGGTYRVKTWWVPRDSTQNPSSNIYGYTFGHPREGILNWMGNSTPYNSRMGITEIINFGPSSPSFLADDYLNHNNLSMTYLQDGIKEDNDTRYWAYRWASGCKLKNTYNPKVWAMFDTRKLTQMTNFFNNYINRNSGLNFNPDVTMWDVGSVQLFNEFFTYLYGFDQDLSNWDVSSATNMNSMFSNATSFNNGGATGIGNWDTSNVTSMASMFNNADAFNQPIGNWNTSNVTNMNNMFNHADAFNQPIGNWDVSNVTSMFSMFDNADVFNQDLSNWDVSSVTSMRRMFRSSNFSNGGATGISDWDVSNVIRFSEMFRGCYTFDADLSTPTWQAGISFATTNNDTWAINYMFWDCWSFNNGGSTGISDWDISGCSRLDNMFVNARVFNHDLSRWDVSSATNMNGMFQGALVFNNGGATGIGDWDVSNVTLMNTMFFNTKAFNQPIGNWDVSNVTNMQVMFQNTEVFNQDIGGWDTSSVSNFFRAFRRAYAFDQDLGNWSLASATNVDGFYDGTSSMSDENYSRLLVGWANFVYDNSGPYNLTLYSNTTQYSNALTAYPGYGSEQFTTAPAARAYLTGATAGWTITDQGQA